MIGTQNKTAALLPYSVMMLAIAGDADAMDAVLLHYDGYINTLAGMRLFDEYGNEYYGVNESLRSRLRTKLIEKTLTFKVR